MTTIGHLGDEKYERIIEWIEAELAILNGARVDECSTVNEHSMSELSNLLCQRRLTIAVVSV